METDVDSTCGLNGAHTENQAGVERDLEMTRLCALAEGRTVSTRAARQCVAFDVTDSAVIASTPTGGDCVYDPLHDDAQAMALVKRFSLQISRRGVDSAIIPAYWLVALPFTKESGFVGHHTENTDLNLAIVECVAKCRPRPR